MKSEKFYENPAIEIILTFLAALFLCVSFLFFWSIIDNGDYRKLTVEFSQNRYRTKIRICNPTVRPIRFSDNLNIHSYGRTPCGLFYAALKEDEDLSTNMSFIADSYHWPTGAANFVYQKEDATLFPGACFSKDFSILGELFWEEKSLNNSGNGNDLKYKRLKVWAVLFQSECGMLIHPHKNYESDWIEISDQMREDYWNDPYRLGGD
ncbi:MAG: hypothetical protein IPH06_03970 [Alphaproteobacteria bacterium]|nr:hypothetical protein [Alphaproteobacteria bacterium]QQS57192.1 MAG: hypothetical protein IPN28_13285 [Alphaproteobacteria bacterium]